MPEHPRAARSHAFGLIGVLIVAVLAAACASVAAAGPVPLRVGAIFPLSGSTAPGSTDEYLGATLAAQMVNTQGGIAGPSGGTPAKPVGLVYIALASKNETVCRSYRFSGNRDAIRQRAVLAALDLLRRV